MSRKQVLEPPDRNNFTMPPQILRRLGNMRLQPVVCVRCQRPIQPGQMVHRKTSSGKASYYHLYCWQSLFFAGETDEDE